MQRIPNSTLESNQENELHKTLENSIYLNNSYLDEDLILNNKRSEFLVQCILYFYTANVLLGILFNLISLATLIKLKNKLNGILCIVFQVAANDLVQCAVCLTEVWTLKKKNWTLPSELCPIVSGMEILSNTLTVYLLLVLNYHTIAICNARPETSNDNSNECLVIKKKRQEEQEAKEEKMKVSVLIPSVFVWFTCASLCVPQLTLSSTFRNSTTVCTIVDPYYSRLLLNMSLIFRIYIPLTLIILSLIILLRKLPAKNDLFFRYFIFTLTLSSLYLLTSMPRNVSFILHSYKGDSQLNIPPLTGFHSSPLINLFVCMLHYCGVFVRPLFYLVLLPEFKEVFYNTFLPCLIKIKE